MSEFKNGDSLLISKQFPLGARLAHRRGDQPAIAAINIVFKEDTRAPVGSMRHVMGHTGTHDPRQPRHGYAPLFGRLRLRDR